MLQFPSPFFINPLAFFADNLKWRNAQTTHGLSALTSILLTSLSPCVRSQQKCWLNLYPELFWLKLFSRCRQWRVQFLTNASDVNALRVQSLVFEGSGASHNEYRILQLNPNILFQPTGPCWRPLCSIIFHWPCLDNSACLIPHINIP